MYLPIGDGQKVRQLTGATPAVKNVASKRNLVVEEPGEQALPGFLNEGSYVVESVVVGERCALVEVPYGSGDVIGFPPLVGEKQ